MEARDVRFFIHEVALVAGDGRVLPVELRPGSWQSSEVALIDLVGDTPDQRHDVVEGRVRGGPDFTGVRFVVGVPFALNHANPLQAQAPLDRGDLFWVWQTGYKFMRIDLAGAGQERSFHLGSTGCASASAVRPPAHPCAQPNRVAVELRGFDPTRGPVRLSLAALIDAMRGSDPVACTGAYEQTPTCRAAYATTGLDPATGTCGGSACAQRLFLSVQ
jgi:uncharacterized repeat protein (TIGR04052 family)